jgi:hypothetical protein
VDFPLMSQDERLESLFLAALSRRPTAAELERCRTVLKDASTPASKAAALGDIFWVLLNSSEFLLNH